MSCGYLWFQPRASPGFDGWIMLVREEFETEDQAIYCEKKRLAAVGGVKEETLRDAGVKLETIGLNVDCGIIYNPPDDGDERTWVLEYFKERMIDFVADDDELVERLLHHQEAVHDELPLHDDGRDDAPSPPGGDKAASDDDDPLPPPREGGDPSSPYASAALGRNAPAPSVAPPPPPPSQPASAADLLHLRRERLRTLWLRTEERAAIMLQRRWRVLQATEEATSRRLVHAAAAVADLEAAGHFQQASETMAAAMVAAKQQHDRIIRNDAATHITHFFLRLRRRAAARHVHELAATAEGKRGLAAIRVQAAARRLLAIDLRRRLATPVVRLGICWGAPSAGDALPLRLEVAPPTRFGDDAAPPGIFEVGAPPASAPAAAPAAAEEPSTDEAAPRARPATPDHLGAPSAMLPSLRNAPILSAATASPIVAPPAADPAAVAAALPPRAPTTAGAPGAAAAAASAAPMASCSLAAADADGGSPAHAVEPSSSFGRLPPLARQPATARPSVGSAGAAAAAAVAGGRRVGSSSGVAAAALGAGAAAASNSPDGAVARAALLLHWPVRAGLRGSVAQQSERGSPGKEGKGNRSSWFKAAMAPFKSASVFMLQLSCAGASWSTTHTYKEILAFDAQLRAAQQQQTPQPPVGSGAAAGLPDLPLAGGRVIRLGAVQAWLAALLDGLTAGALVGGAVLLLGTFLQLQLPPLVRLQACARGWRARKRWRQADGQQLAGSAPV